MTATERIRLRELGWNLVAGAALGTLLALPLPVAARFFDGVGSPLQTAGLGLTRSLLVAVAPGLVFSLGVASVGVPLNALVWAGSWAVWRSRNPHASAIAAKLITAICWLGWGGVSLLLGTLPGGN